MVLYERAKEILNAPHRHLFASSGKPDCLDFGFGRSAICLYSLLNSKKKVNSRQQKAEGISEKSARSSNSGGSSGEL